MKQKIPIPVATQPPKKSDYRRATYKLYVDLTQAVKETLSGVNEEELQGMLASYMQLMDPPEDAKEITLTPEEVKQTGLLSAQCLARQLHERSKNK